MSLRFAAACFAVACSAEPPVAAAPGSAPSGRSAVAPAPLADRRPTAPAYALPFEAGAVVRVGQGYHGAFSHAGTQAYAIDFPVPEGTPVVAARAGTVWSVSDDSDEGCGDPECAALVNVVVIDHGDGTFASYHHLAYDSAQVRVGESVEQGRWLALSGATGRTTAPHLHFQVRDAWGTTLPVSFRELAASGGAAYAGVDLVSANTTGAAVSTEWSTCPVDTFAFLGLTLDPGAPCSVAGEVTTFSGRLWVPGAVPVLTVLDDTGLRTICPPERVDHAGDRFELEVDWAAEGWSGEVLYTLSAGRASDCTPFQPTSAAVSLRVP